MTPEERVLVQRAIAGERVAIERLLMDAFHPLKSWVIGQRWQVDGLVVDSDEIVQQTMIQVFRSIHTFEPRSDGSFLAWLKVIAANKHRDLVRQEGRLKRGGGGKKQRGTDENPFAELIDALLDDDHTASRSLAKREIVVAIHVAMELLPEDHRRAIELRYLKDLSLEETAQQMGVTTGAVRGYLDRGKKKLNDLLASASNYLSRD